MCRPQNKSPFNVQHTRFVFRTWERPWNFRKTDYEMIIWSDKLAGCLNKLRTNEVIMLTFPLFSPYERTRRSILNMAVRTLKKIPQDATASFQILTTHNSWCSSLYKLQWEQIAVNHNCVFNILLHVILQHISAFFLESHQSSCNVNIL